MSSAASHARSPEPHPHADEVPRRHAFRIGGLGLVLGTDVPTELARIARPARLPGTADWLLGMHAVRGDFAPVFDVGAALGLDVPARATRGREAELLVLLAGSGSKLAGVQIDGLPLGLPLTEFEPAEPAVDAAEPAAFGSYVIARLAARGREWLEIDLHALLMDLRADVLVSNS